MWDSKNWNLEDRAISPINDSNDTENEDPWELEAVSFRDYSYPTSPFYPFGKLQDIGNFENAIGSPSQHLRQPFRAESPGHSSTRRRRHSVDTLDFAGVRIGDVGTFLRHIRLHKYEDLLHDQGVTMTQLLAMDEAGLEGIGIHAQGARTRLLKAIERYNGQAWERSIAREGLQTLREDLGGHDTQNCEPIGATQAVSQPMAVPTSRKGRARVVHIRRHYDNDSDDDELLEQVNAVAEQLLVSLSFDSDHLADLYATPVTPNLTVGSPIFTFNTDLLTSSPEMPRKPEATYDLWTGQPVLNRGAAWWGPASSLTISQ